MIIMITNKLIITHSTGFVKYNNVAIPAIEDSLDINCTCT